MKIKFKDIPFTPVSWVEYHLKNRDKLATLPAEQVTYFWSHRSWHPVVNMHWEAETISKGEGEIIYPDNSKLKHEMGMRPDLGRKANKRPS